MGLAVTLVLAGLLAVLPLALIVVFGTSLCIALCQQTELAPFLPAPEHMSFKAESARAQIEEAEQLGLGPVGAVTTGASRQRDEPIAVMLLSQNLRVLMLVYADTKAAGYCLYSRMEEGRWIVTEDRFAGPEMSPYYMPCRLVGASMQQTLTYHLDRIEADAASCLVFEPGRVIEDIHAQEAMHVQYLVQKGWARWTDPAQTAWRMTLRGALKQAWRSAVEPVRKGTADRQEKYVSGS